jgi:hypothetical protein
MRGSWGAFVVVVGLVGLVGVAGLAGVGCGSSSPPPAPGQGGGGTGGGGATAGAGGGGLAGAAGSCPDTSTPTDLPIKINTVDECPFVGADTAGCGAGTFEYDCPDPLGLGVPPEAGCTHPTSGTNTTMRWCCTSALCSRFFSRDARCDCASANPHDYNCAPGSLAAATCAANTSGDVCCPFTD